VFEGGVQQECIGISELSEVPIKNKFEPKDP
jgi:hypothetical protein